MLDEKNAAAWQWYDYLIPTTMFGAITFGLIISLIYAFIAKKETGSWLRFSGALTAGMISTLIVAYVLDKLGYLG
jgi:hypothetical protein